MILGRFELTGVMYEKRSVHEAAIMQPEGAIHATAIWLSDGWIQGPGLVCDRVEELCSWPVRLTEKMRPLGAIVIADGRVRLIGGWRKEIRRLIIRAPANVTAPMTVNYSALESIIRTRFS